ncbi:zinc ribbon domain-containing protein [Lutispora thermophila]|uniref:Putative zinc ribbon domain-containing protein n=1 Tax=Lutispora thermophila DSM 19022 TaxID=1122184 RepID=A0A1M6ISK1_9FIRM|nr:zinc ribbon domain-containing protein [Lutispora thermophila]SHJ37422.1 Putative zinc ribbon domain-containing protein [Lutispora thermophila DSM 19022]
MKTCIACGMPMEDIADFAANDPSKDYCIYCSRPDGEMQSFEEKKESFTKFLVMTQGFDENVARKIAEGMMRKLPSWEKYFD